MTKQKIEACKNAARYSGKSFPRCNGGKPCKACLLKYATVQSGAEVHAVHPAEPAAVCPCGYDQRIAGGFDQVARRINGGKRVPSTQDYIKALGHTEFFPLMVNAMLEDESEEHAAIYGVLADGVRYGVELGRTLEEVERLEEMVGFTERKL